MEARSQKGYLVPDNPSPTEFEYRLIKIPTDPQWQQTYSYVIGILTFGYVWDKDSGNWQAAQTTALDVLNCYIGLSEGCMDICSLVADCVANNPETLQAIIGALQSAGFTSAPKSLEGTPPSPLSMTQISANLLPDDYTCDDNHLFGMSRFIAQNLNDGTQQLLQQIEAATNSTELLAVLGDNVEGLSYILTPLEFITWAQQQLAEYYELAWSTSVFDEISCAIYCAIKGSCEVTLNILIDAYADIVTQSFSLPSAFDALDDVFQFFDALDYDGAIAAAIVASFHYGVLQLLRFGTAALDYTSGIRSLKQIISLGANDTDGDWITLCEDCPTDTVTPTIVVPCFGGGSGGTITSLGGIRYRFTATPRATDKAITLGAVGGELWKLANISNIVGSSTFYGWHISGGSCAVGVSPPNAETNPMIEFGWTQNIAASPTFQFDADFIPAS